jgi:hypothetical protein
MDWAQYKLMTKERKKFLLATDNKGMTTWQQKSGTYKQRKNRIGLKIK